MNKVVFTLLSGLILLVLANQTPSVVRNPNIPLSFANKKMLSLAKSFKTKAHKKRKAKLIISMIFGFKRGLRKKLIQKFEDLNLLHLFTPSGLHFSSLFIFLNPLFGLSRRFHYQAPKGFTLIFCFLPFLLGKFYSLKRIALLKILTLLFKRKVSFYILFLLTFLFDFLFGSYQDSPLSFAYSYIFLGILISTGKVNLKLFLGLFAGQLLLALSFQGSINLIGPFFGFFITTIFTFMFPLLIILFALFPFITTRPAEFLINIFLYLVDFFWQMAQNFPEIKVHFGTVFIMILLLSSLNRKNKIRLGLVGFLIFL